MIFIDGCFWPGCPECSWTSASSIEYWLPKLEQSMAKDREANQLFSDAGWTVLQFWEHEPKRSPERVLARIRHRLTA